MLKSFGSSFLMRLVKLQKILAFNTSLSSPKVYREENLSRLNQNLVSKTKYKTLSEIEL